MLRIQGRTALGCTAFVYTALDYTALDYTAMRHTAPLAEVGRAKTGAGAHATCPRGRPRAAVGPFSGAVRHRCDASLPVDRQMTHRNVSHRQAPTQWSREFVRTGLWSMSDLFDEVTEQATQVHAKARRDRRRLIDRLHRDE
jgi:hypothetical protein